MSTSKKFIYIAALWLVCLSSYAFYEYTECKKYITSVYNSKPGMWILAPRKKVTENIFFIVTERNFFNSRVHNKDPSIPISINSNNLIGYFGVPVLVLLMLALASRIKPSSNP